MMIKLVLFIDDEETYESFDYPLKGNEDLDPRSTYVALNGLDKTEDFPNNYPTLNDFRHEWKIMFKDE